MRRFSLDLLEAKASPVTQLNLPRPPAPPNGNGRGKLLSSGVAFVGPEMRNSALSWYVGGANPNLERLNRAAAFMTSAYCYSAMQWRATRVAEAPLMVIRVTEDGEEWQPGHPLAEFLDTPRPDVEMSELLERSMYYLDGTGAALWVLDRNGLNRPAMATPFSAEQFRTKQAGPLIYGGYEILKGGRWEPVQQPQRIPIHFRVVNPHSWREPLSLVDVALAQLDLGHQVNRIVRNFLSRAIFPGGVVSPDPEWHPTPDEWEDWKDAFEQWQGGPANAGAPFYAQGGTTFTRTAAGVAELLPEELLDRVEATVAAVAGVAPVVLGWLVGLKNSPWSNMGEARRQSYEDTVAGLWRKIERPLSRSLLTPEERAGGLAIRFDTSKIAALQEDQEANARIAALNADHWTVDERRIFTGQEPLEKGDERGEIIVGLPSSREPAADDVGLGADREEDDEPDPDEDEKADSKDLAWLVFDIHTKAGERRWELGILGELVALRTETLKIARRTLKEAKALDPESSAEFAKQLAEMLESQKGRMIAKVYPLVIGTGEKAVRRLGARVGVSFSVLQPGLLKYASEEAAFLVSVMGKQTGKAVAAAVQKGLAEGDTIRGLIERLEVLPAFDRTRAKLVARTETTRAWNGSQRRAMSEYERSSGKRATKTWLTSRDARVREEHAELEGEEKRIDEPFSNGLQEPGEPNCRCTLAYGFTDTDTPVRGTQP